MSKIFQERLILICVLIFSTKIYNHMRLMLLGSDQTGKTSLLQAFKRESLNVNNPQPIQRKVSGKNLIGFEVFVYF
jgi:GTPase SAR1 family protein